MRNTIPCTKIIVFRPELSSRPDWLPRWCPIFVDILCILCISGTVQTYVTANIDVPRVPMSWVKKATSPQRCRPCPIMCRWWCLECAHILGHRPHPGNLCAVALDEGSSSDYRQMDILDPIEQLLDYTERLFICVGPSCCETLARESGSYIEDVLGQTSHL